MSFVGPVTHLDGALVRPHDLEITVEPGVDTAEMRVVRLVHLGFEVRVELQDGAGERRVAQVTRDEVERLGLRAGRRVFIAATRSSSFTSV
jgi:sulfate transport system ATP-binding protein